jgi:hypothetical protein
MFHDISPRTCPNCGQQFRPERSHQVYCRQWCRMKAKAAEGRAARRTWWKAGKPTLEQIERGGDERSQR